MSDFVTRDEFGALRDDVREIRRDVKRLLRRDAGALAIEKERNAFWSKVGSKSTFTLTVIACLSLVLSIVATTQRVWFLSPQEET